MSAMGTTGAGGTVVRKADILGCWRLERALEERDGVVGPNRNYGDNPIGFLHYLAEDRVAVTVSLGGRPLESVTNADRRRAPDAELATEARTFDAYAGRFSITGPNLVVHHVEISLFQNDVGTDFVRGIAIEGDRLTLYPPDLALNTTTLKRWLEWRRIRPS